MSVEPEPIYQGFLGTWTLDPGSCDYEQGEAPVEGTLRIEESQGTLEFLMDWTDAEGEHHQARMSGAPDGQIVPFAGGKLADAISVQAVSARELNTSAYWQGKELMLAQRQLDDTGQAMRITQVVRFPNGSTLANVGIYRKNARA